MESQLLTVLAAIGALCILVAAFAWDWRAGIAVIGAGLVAVALRLEGVREVEP